MKKKSYRAPELQVTQMKQELPFLATGNGPTANFMQDPGLSSKSRGNAEEDEEDLW